MLITAGSLMVLIITALYLLEEELSKKKKNINGKYK